MQNIYGDKFHGFEVGIEECLLCYNYIIDVLKIPKEQIVIVDADDLLENPEFVLRNYCEIAGLTFSDSMLNWEDGDIPPEWNQWEGWHDDARRASQVCQKEVSEGCSPCMQVSVSEI